MASLSVVITACLYDLIRMMVITRIACGYFRTADSLLRFCLKVDDTGCPWRLTLYCTGLRP